MTFLEIDVNGDCQIMFKQNPRSTLWFWENFVSQLLCLALKGIPWKQETALSLHCDHKAICLTFTVCSGEHRPMRSCETRVHRMTRLWHHEWPHGESRWIYGNPHKDWVGLQTCHSLSLCSSIFNPWNTVIFTNNKIFLYGNLSFQPNWQCKI